MGTTSAKNYQTRIVPALREIQERLGYLPAEELKKLAERLDIPRYRLQEVASFFPHFRLTPPPQVTLRICRDTSCHMAGAGEVLKELKKLKDERVCVEGVSCLGRCDRPVAACATIHKSGEEHYYLGRAAASLKKIAADCLAGNAPKPDRDAERDCGSSFWKINPYTSSDSHYAAVRRVAVARKEWEAKFDRPDSGHEGSGKQPFESSDWSELLMAELDEAHADLRGMGGAGIPATQKWRDVRDAVRSARRRGADDRAFIIVNADESEPGTFKDRELLLRLPHLIVEGLILAGAITDASEGFIYIRHEYHEQIEACRREIERAEKLGMCGQKAAVLGRSFPVSVFVSPGGYVCGEQSALVEAMSDRRAEPRNLPPKLETNGLDDQPTLVSNVETYAWVPYILLNGGKAYADLGTNGWRGRRLFSVSGDVSRPGVYEVPMGLTLRELICGKEYCQGISGGRRLKGVAPSGPSGGFLPAQLTASAGLPRNYTSNKSWQQLASRRGLDAAATTLDVLDLELELNLFRAISPTQALGAGIIVYAHGRDMADQAFNALEFFRNESCGKCVPCRIGSQKLAALARDLVNKRLDAEVWKDELLPLVKELSKALELTSICGLGRSVPLPLRTAIEFFPDDVSASLGSKVKDVAKEAC